jgi:hypothetical protein
VWKRALDLPFDPGIRNGAAVLPSGYRGSLLLLDAGTTYEIEAKEWNGAEIRFSSSTRPEVAHVSVGRRIPVTDKASLLTISSGGSAEAYVVYEGQGSNKATFDAERTRAYCMVLNGANNPVQFIIFRNIRFMGALEHCVLLGSTAAGNRELISNIIFDQCEFSDWGSPGAPRCRFAGNLQSGVYSATTALENVTVQGCHFHDPAMGANSWYPDDGPACTGNKHPEGVQCVTFKRSRGGHVFRFNTFEGSRIARLNDGAGETANFTDGGFPGSNCDFHNNVIRFTNDDGLELEGRDNNIRVWDNLFEECFDAIGLAPVFRGPVYIWGNIGRSSSASVEKSHGHSFLKWRRTNGGSQDWSGGHVYVFNNTLAPAPPGIRGFSSLYRERSAAERISKWHVWNNVVAAERAGGVRNCSFADLSGVDNDIQRNVFSGGLLAPRERETPAANLTGDPVFETNDWNAATGVGTFRLSRKSLGYAQGIQVPAVYDGVPAPDCGAHQHTQRTGVGYGHLHLNRVSSQLRA